MTPEDREAKSASSATDGRPMPDAVISPGVRHQADGLIARAMTVEASKLYARLYFRHQLSELERP